MCQLAPPSKLDGQSLVPLLQNPSSANDRTAMTAFDVGNISLRTNHWRYIRYTDKSEELYDNDADPHEWTNLASDPKHAEIVSKSFERSRKNRERNTRF